MVTRFVNKNSKVSRPLLKMHRFEIRQFVRFWKLPIYSDQSNKKTNFSRNKVRKQLMPTLRIFFNPQIDTVLLNFAEIRKCEQLYFQNILNFLLKPQESYPAFFLEKKCYELRFPDYLIPPQLPCAQQSYAPYTEGKVHFIFDFLVTPLPLCTFGASPKLYPYTSIPLYPDTPIPPYPYTSIPLYPYTPIPLYPYTPKGYGVILSSISEGERGTGYGVIAEGERGTGYGIRGDRRRRKGYGVKKMHRREVKEDLLYSHLMMYRIAKLKCPYIEGKSVALETVGESSPSKGTNYLPQKQKENLLSKWITKLHKVKITNWFHYGARNQVIYWLIFNDNTIKIIHTYPSVFQKLALKSILKTFVQVENALTEWNEKKLVQLLIVNSTKKVFTQKEKKKFLIFLYKLLKV